MLSVPYKAEEIRMLGDAKSVLSSSNWHDLPPDLLRLIYRKLYDTFDFINFRVVCKGWLAVAPLSEHPPQFPYLLVRGTICTSKFKLYSLHTDKIRKIEVPEARNKVFNRQSQGYLVTYKTGCNNTSLTLLNPFTRAEVPLPFHGWNFYKLLHVGSEPIQNSDNMVIYVTIGCESRFVGCWKNNQNNEWSLKGGFPSRVQAYNRGRLFFPNFSNNCTTILDLTTGNKLEARLPYNDHRGRDFSCLGEGAGTFLGIQQHFHSCTKSLSMENCWFEVYQLNEEKNPPCWIKMSDIGDLIIFLNSDNTGFCLSASNFDGISGNCIYFTSWHVGRLCKVRMLIGLYEMGKHGSEVIGQLKSRGTWIVPNVY